MMASKWSSKRTACYQLHPAPR